jgi:uncharacterized protein (TIRG00374 family)
VNRNRVWLLARLAVSAALIAWLLRRVDAGAVAREMTDVGFATVAAIVALQLLNTGLKSYKWQRLLDADGIHLAHSTAFASYLVSSFFSLFLPTAVGGDAVRIYETAKRHTGRGGDVAGSVLLERALGGAATLALAAVGFVLALGQNYDVAAYLWIEFAFVIGTVVLAVALFARRARPLLARTVPLLRLVRLDRPIRAAYEGIHSYRDHPGLLGGVFALTLGVQTVRVLAIWSAGKAVGVDLSPRPYYVMGPLLFLVLLVPFTINGIAVRESFFVSFLGGLGVGADEAFATGFLFFAVTLCLSVPGGVLLAWQSIRGLFHRPVTPDHG